MKNHTPGPWHTSKDAVPEGHVQITVYAEADGQRVATVFRERDNAELIAGAPDLLADNQRLHEQLAKWYDENQRLGQENMQLREALRDVMAHADGAVSLARDCMSAVEREVRAANERTQIMAEQINRLTKG